MAPSATKEVPRSSERATARRAQEVFDGVASFTVGAEEELLLVHPRSFDPIPLGEVALLLAGPDSRLAAELRACQVEAVTPICVAVADVARELASVRTLLHRRLGGQAVVVAAGTHPLARDPGPVSAARRYAELADAHPWAVPRLLTCGLHIHVALGGAKRALAVHNALRSYLPALTALGANAPFHEGVDSGLQTVRPRLNECLPRTGIPPAFASWDAWGDLLDWSYSGGLLPDASYQWWDLRLHPRHGTLEIRAPDTQLQVEDTATIVAVVQSLVATLAAHYDEGAPLPVHPTERIAENRRLAARDGVTGALVDLDTGQPVQTAELLHTLAEELLPAASELGCAAELGGVDLLIAEGGAARQHRIVRELGIDALLLRLASESVAHASHPTAGPMSMRSAA